MRDAVRLALGTLTIVPVRPPRRLDRGTAGLAMALAPLVGLLLGLVVAGALRVLELLRSPPSPLLAAALALVLLAVLTRGMHLDGLADTADGLGSRRAPAEALALMRAGDVGPFGVATLVLALLAQAAALATLLGRHAGLTEVVVAAVVSRLVVPLLCTRGVPAARADGLGSTVAGSVSRPRLALALVLAALATGATMRLGTGPGVVPGLVVTLVPLVLTGLFAGRCVRRFGGITGDVLGAGVEVAFTLTLVLACLV